MTNAIDRQAVEARCVELLGCNRARLVEIGGWGFLIAETITEGGSYFTCTHPAASPLKGEDYFEGACVAQGATTEELMASLGEYARALLLSAEEFLKEKMSDQG